MTREQYLMILKLRGVTDLLGETITTALTNTGGVPSKQEMLEIDMLEKLDELGL